MKLFRTLALTAAALALAASVSFAQTTTPATKAQKNTATKTTKTPTTTEKISATDLPDAVSAAIKKQWPNASITTASRVTAGAMVTYKVALKNASKTVNAVVTADGVITSPKIKK